MTTPPLPLGSGSDDTASLQSFLQTASGAVDLAGGTYLLAGTLELQKPNLSLSNGILRALGVGAIPHRPQLRQTGGKLILDAIEIVGANPRAGINDDAYVKALENQHCAELLAVDQFTAIRSHFHESYGDLVYLHDGPPTAINKCVWLINSLFENSGRQGVTLNGVRGFLLDNSPVNNIRMSTFVTEPNTPTTEIGGVTIRNTHFGARRQYFYAYSGGDHNANIHDIVVDPSCTGDKPFTYSGWGGATLRPT